ncbi:MAG: Aminotransferase, DegT/DnrJ/EryC1/StrS family [Candidatus Fermentimicrarchaeum limneticum]|uniref:Aminotransferase, DegT/DnrJ/EryC1/StrS family n=1 Tax=Fermentimicrarchaeum limneticum TaxID=2795018 RepID=A0A7D6B9F2_FERL1|nr:MAG: Aminotransferase, DegT/DnrJ/EryC1/StrS family [Candidatus Fermentimicrarchaeum limneticum]
MLPISKPCMGEEEIRAVIQTLRSGQLSQGSKVREFEENFSEYVGVKHAIATTNGTSSLHVALLSAGIGKGAEVITTPFSFVASSNSILYCGAKPIFVDIGKDFNINPDLIEEKITGKTKAVLVVHLYGQPCEMDKITEICDENNLLLIEDACQAHGAEFNKRKVGSFGIAGCFSFYPTKNMTTGEGGMITTNDDRVAEKARMVINHGSKVRYHHEILGYNYRMTDIQAAIGIEQLKKLDGFNEMRIRNANLLTMKLKDVEGIVLPKTYKNRKHVFHQYTISITDRYPIGRDALTKKLESARIGCGVYYPLPIHKQKLYIRMGYSSKLPVSEKVSREVVSLPIHPLVRKADLEKISRLFIRS